MRRVLLQIDACKNTGSTGKISEDIGRVAIKHGWESWKVYSCMHRDSQPSESHLIETGSKLGFYLSVLETRVFDNHCLGYSNVGSTKQLIQRIEEINPDIIQLHDIKGYFLNIRVLFEYLRRKDIPIVWTLHSCWQFTGHCGHFDYCGCDRWKNGCYHCPQKKDYPQSMLFDRSRKNWVVKKGLFLSVKNLTLIPVSYWLSDFVADSFLQSLPRKVIHNGIDIQDFKIHRDTKGVKEKYGIRELFTVICVSGVWTQKKGFYDIIKLRQVLPEEIQIIVVGLTENQLLQLPAGVVGIQKTESRDELAQLYSLADVFFNPTYEDNFPTTNIEALACGTPVVTYRTGGSVEAVDENTGFIMEQGEYEKLKDIIEVIRSKGRDYYKRTCRSRAERLYDKDKCFEEYMTIYDSLLRK